MKKVFIAIVVILILVVGAIGYKYTLDLNAKEKSDIELKEELTEKYDSFEKQVKSFSKERTSFLKRINNDVEYLEDLSNRYESLVKRYQNLESMLNKINDSSKDLKDKLIGKEFESKDLINIQSNFIANYERVNNYFVNDIKSFNNEIDRYNEMVTNNIFSGKKLDKYKTNYTEYVDINKDGNFDGKEIEE